MATSKENQELATDTANTLLTRIQYSAGLTADTEALLELAQAYATVKEAMPRPTKDDVGPRRRVL